MKLLSTKRSDDKVAMKFKKFKDHEEMANRLTKTFYYGKNPQTDRPSLAMTDIAVELFSEAVPNVGLDQIDMHYAATVSRNACASPCSLMLALVYIDRLRRTNPDYLRTVSSSDIFLISMMIASKFLYDEGEEEEVFNDEWAASANMDTKEVNQIEREFLAALDWNLFVNVATLKKVLHHFESQIALKEGLKRGWFSYTDLEILSKNLPGLESLYFFMDNVFKVAIACALAYTAGILTIIGATILVHRGIEPHKWLSSDLISINIDSSAQHEVHFNKSLSSTLDLHFLRFAPRQEKADCYFYPSTAQFWMKSKSSDSLEVDNNESLSKILVASVKPDKYKLPLSFENSIMYSPKKDTCDGQKLLLQTCEINSSKCSKSSVILFSR